MGRGDGISLPPWAIRLFHLSSRGCGSLTCEDAHEMTERCPCPSRSGISPVAKTPAASYTPIAGARRDTPIWDGRESAGCHSTQWS